MAESDKKAVSFKISVGTLAMLTVPETGERAGDASTTEQVSEMVPPLPSSVPATAEPSDATAASATATEAKEPEATATEARR